MTRQRRRAWLQFALATPVVGWAAWPFFVRGWRSVVSPQLNMFTLIAFGVGAAYLFSTVTMLLPQALHHDGKTPLEFKASATLRRRRR